MVLWKYIESSMAKKKDKRTIKSNPKTVDGINFRSELEVATYKRLKAAGIPFEYEKRVYELLPTTVPDHASWEFKYDKFSPKTRKILPTNYTPDFTCPKGKWIIECKGFANQVFPIKWKIFRQNITLGKYPDLKAPVLFLPHGVKDVDICISIILSTMT